jgi:hypothetical protein
MANTFELIASATVGSGGAANIDFSSIPSTYTDLCIKASIRTDRTNVEDWLTVRFNNLSTNLNSILLRGTGSGVTSSTATDISGRTSGDSSTASTFGNASIYIPNYAGSTTKPVSIDSVSENNSTAAIQVFTAGLWNQTAAINRVTLLSQLGTNFLQYSTAYLYGVKNA